MQTLKPRDILALGVGTIIGVGWITWLIIRLRHRAEMTYRG